MNNPQASFEKTFSKDVFQNSTVHVNFGQDFIVTTEDKLRLCMVNHATKLGDQNAWIGPTSLFVTILLVLLTTDFRDSLSIPKATWHAVFLLSALATGIWSGVTGIRAWNTTSTVETIISELKRTSQANTEIGSGEDSSHNKTLNRSGGTTGFDMDTRLPPPG